MPVSTIFSESRAILLNTDPKLPPPDPDPDPQLPDRPFVEPDAPDPDVFDPLPEPMPI